MRELIFVIKTLLLTAVVVVLCRIQTDQGSVEQRAVIWIEQTAAIKPINEVIQGGAKLVRGAWHRIVSYVNTKNIPGSRELGVTVERSRAYLEDQAQQLQQEGER